MSKVFPPDDEGRVGKDWVIPVVRLLPEFGDSRELYAGGPLPFPPPLTLSLADRYFVLALVHDAGRHDGDRINPWQGDSRGSNEATTWAAQMSRVEHLKASDKLALDDCLHHVEADLRESGLIQLEVSPTPAKNDASVESDAKQLRHPRLHCDPSDRSVWLDGKRLDCGLDEDVFAYFRILADRYPHPISFPDMCEQSVALEGVNQTRLKTKIPHVIRKLVKTIPNKGHVLLLPP